MTIGQAEAAIQYLTTFAGMTEEEAQEMIDLYIQRMATKKFDILEE